MSSSWGKKIVEFEKEYQQTLRLNFNTPGTLYSPEPIPYSNTILLALFWCIVLWRGQQEFVHWTYSPGSKVPLWTWSPFTAVWRTRCTMWQCTFRTETGRILFPSEYLTQAGSLSLSESSYRLILFVLRRPLDFFPLEIPSFLSLEGTLWVCFLNFYRTEMNPPILIFEKLSI